MEFEEGDSLITITGRNININPHDNMNDNEYRSDTLHLITNPDFHDVKTNCAKFIKSLCKSEIAQEYHGKVKGKIYYASHEEVQSRNIKLFNLLKDVVKEIMNKKLDYYTDEHLTPIVTLDKRILNPSELSDGEKELLAYCTFLVLQRQDEIGNKTLSLKNKILLLDELELFLHPKAQIDLINGLRNLVGENGQIWLATHSLSILSVLDRDEIWLMDNGDINFSKY
jgi:predicted ATP-binding protein involved in virulence